MAVQRLKEILGKVYSNGRWFGIENKAAFVLCLLIALVMWLLNALERNYSHNMSVPVEYINMPEGKGLIAPLPETLEIEVNAKGSDLFQNSFGFGDHKLVLDYQRDINQEVMPSSTLSNTIVRKLGIQQVTDIRPDTLFFLLDDFAEKKVPVILKQEIGYNTLFEPKGKPKIEPDSITISGSATAVDTLQSWPSLPVIALDAKANLSGTIELQQPQVFNLQLSQNSVNYNIEVEEFTEKTLEIPINPVNLPEATSVIIYPKTAKVSFRVSFSDFKEVEAGMFTAVADFADVDLGSNQPVRVVLAKKAYKVSNIRIKPEFPKYIVYQK